MDTASQLKSPLPYSQRTLVYVKLKKKKLSSTDTQPVNIKRKETGVLSPIWDIYITSAFPNDKGSSQRRGYEDAKIQKQWMITHIKTVFFRQGSLAAYKNSQHL